MTEGRLSITRAAVIGGGVSGLVAAWELARSGVAVTVWEAEGHWGGAVSALTLGGITADAGAEAIAVGRPAGLQLIEDLGLRGDVLTPRRTDSRIAMADGLRELPPSVLGVPADLDDPRVASLLSAADIERARDEREAVSDSTTTVGAYVRERLGDAVVDRIVDPVIAGVHACAADDADLNTLLPGIGALVDQTRGLVPAAARMRAGLGPSGSAVASLRGGMHRLTAALVDACCATGVDLRHASGISRIQRTDDGWRVTDTTGAVTDVDVVVLAVPPRVAADLLHDDEPQLAASLGAIETTAVRVVSLLIECPDLDEFPAGPGVLVAAERTDVQAKAMTHANAKWEWWDDVLPANRHVVRLSYGRAGQPAPAVEGLVEQAEADAKALLGVTGSWRVIDSAVTTWQESLVRPTPGHAQRMRDLTDQLHGLPDLTVLNSALAGNGLAGIIQLAREEATRVVTSRPSGHSPQRTGESAVPLARISAHSDRSGEAP